MAGFRRCRIGGMFVLPLLLASGAWAQMVTGESMPGYEATFGVKNRQPSYAFDVAQIATTAPANILHPGEQAAFTLQLVNTSDQPLVGDFHVDVIHYGTTGSPGDIWVPYIFKVADVERLPIQVDLPARDAWQNLTVSPTTPETFGGYALVVDLGPAGRRFASAYARTLAPIYKQETWPQIALDLEDPDALVRLGIAPNRMGFSFYPSDDPRVRERRAVFLRRLDAFRERDLPVTVEFGAGIGDGPTQPLGRLRPWLDPDGNMLPTNSDYAWLPSYDEDFRHFVRDLCLEYGQPHGPLNAVKLWNEPWEGLSIAGWGADMLRYREIYRALALGVEDARTLKPELQVLIGGCDSTANTFDKLFSDGSDEFLKWLDFCSIHYQEFYVPATIKAWRDRQARHGRVRAWETESWVANTEDRVAGAIATGLATGLDRVNGIFTGNLSKPEPRQVFGDDGKRREIQQPVSWSTAASVAAAANFIGPRRFRELLFRNGLPWIMVFDPPAAELVPGGAANPDDGMVVVVGDIGAASGHNYLLFRNALGTAELRTPERTTLSARLDALLTAAAAPAPESRAKVVADFAAAVAEQNQRQPLSGARLTLADPDRRFRLGNGLGNAVAREDNGGWVIPLDHTGYYLATDGTPGSFAALLAALRSARVDGIEPLAKEVLDFTAPIAAGPTLRLRLTNVLNRPVSGTLSVSMPGLTLENPTRAAAFGPHETHTLRFRVADGATAPDNNYPLVLRFDAGDDGVSTHAEMVHVNFIPRREVVVDGRLDEWEGSAPLPITAGGSGPTLTERAWEPYRDFDESAARGSAYGYAAYDDDCFYFAAKIADHTPHPGTLRVEGRDDDHYFYPVESRAVDRDRSDARRLSNRNTHLTRTHADRHGLRVPGDGDQRFREAWSPVGKSWSLEVTVPEGERRRLSLYFMDPTPQVSHRAPVIVTDLDGRQLDRHVFERYPTGFYTRYAITGAVRVTVEEGRDGPQSLCFGIFLDPLDDDVKPEGEVVNAPNNTSVAFLGTDEQTLGDWEGVYGRLGYEIAGQPPVAPTDGTRIEIVHKPVVQEYRWPEGVRRYTYRKDPVLPCGNWPTFDNVQLAFNALPASDKPWYSHPPGTMPRFIAYADTDYEYALNTIAPENGGGTEVVRLRHPNIGPKHHYPRQPMGPGDGAVTGARLVTRHENGTRWVECALPWAEIPGVRARLDAGEPLKFTFRVNDNGAGNACLELARDRSVSKRNISFRADWVEHWANELEFGWEDR